MHSDKGTSESELKALFARMDANKDGSIDPQVSLCGCARSVVWLRASEPCVRERCVSSRMMLSHRFAHDEGQLGHIADLCALPLLNRSGIPCGLCAHPPARLAALHQDRGRFAQQAPLRCLGSSTSLSRAVSTLFLAHALMLLTQFVLLLRCCVTQFKAHATAGSDTLTPVQLGDLLAKLVKDE